MSSAGPAALRCVQGAALLVWLASVTALGCTPSTPSDPQAPAPSEASAPSTASATTTSPPGRPPGSPRARAVAVLVVESKDGALQVVSSLRVPREDLGVGATFNGRGTASFRWALVGADGEPLDGGPIAARRDVHVPDNRTVGAPAAHASRDASAFVVRAPYPEEGERIEIVSTSDVTVKTEWRP